MDTAIAILMLSAYIFFVYRCWQNRNKTKRKASRLSSESEKLLTELTDLRVLQAEIIAQIEDIQCGRYVKASIKREHGNGTMLSQESLLTALLEDEKKLSEQIFQKSLEFVNSMERCSPNGRTNEEQTEELTQLRNERGGA